MSKQAMMAVIVIVVLLVGGYGVYKIANKMNATTPTTPAAQTTPVAPDAMSSMAPTASSSDTTMDMGTVKEFTVTGSSFKFSPATLSVNKGDTVKITFSNSGGMHNITFPDFNAASKTIQSGATDTFQFVADKAGSFQYYCSVGNHKAMGMVGTLTVK